jgi:hypothetical protein
MLLSSRPPQDVFTAAGGNKSRAGCSASTRTRVLRIVGLQQIPLVTRPDRPPEINHDRRPARRIL